MSRLGGAVAAALLLAAAPRDAAAGEPVGVEPTIRSAVVEVELRFDAGGVAASDPPIRRARRPEAGRSAAQAPAGGSAGLPTVRVEMTYELEPNGAVEASFRAIRFGDAEPVGVQARLIRGDAPRELPFRVSAGDGGVFVGTAELPPTPPGQPLRLRLGYQVGGAVSGALDRLDLRLPLLVSEWPPADARPGTWTATVRLPVDLHLMEAFPSHYREMDASAGAAGEAWRTYRFELAVVPSLIHIRAVRGERPWLTTERAVDLSTVAVLAALGWIGLRRFRRLVA